MRPFVFSLVIGAGALVATGGLSAQQDHRAANSRFAGVWQLVGEETRDAKGQAAAPAASAASGGRVGYIAYDPAGYMGVVLARRV